MCTGTLCTNSQIPCVAEVAVVGVVGAAPRGQAAGGGPRDGSRRVGVASYHRLECPSARGVEPRVVILYVGPGGL